MVLRLIVFITDCLMNLFISSLSQTLSQEMDNPEPLEQPQDLYPIGKKISKEVMQDFKHVFQSEPRIKCEQSDEDNEEQFLDRVENMITRDQKKNKSEQQFKLEQKVEQLQQRCLSLAHMNQSLLKKIEENKNSGQNENLSPRWTVPITPRDDTSFVEEISEIQNQFGEIEEVLACYREQLTQYQTNVNKQKTKYTRQIEFMKKQIKSLEQQIYSLQKSAAQEKILKNKLTKRNNELLLQLQNLQQEYQELYDDNKRREQSFSSSKMSRNAYSLNGDECLIEMQKMIDQLAAEVEYQRNLREKVSNQVKRLSLQLKRQSKKIQKKNNQIYTLERELLNLKKHIVHECSIFEEGKQIQFVRSPPNTTQKNLPQSRNLVQNYSSNRRLSGFLQAVIRREPAQTNIQPIGLRYKKYVSEKSQDGSNIGEGSKKILKKNNSDFHSQDYNPNQEKREIKREGIPHKPRKFTFDLGQSYERQTGIKSIPQIADEFYRMSLQKFLTEYEFPEQTILLACKKIITLFNQVQQKQQTRVMFCLQNLQVSHFQPQEPNSLQLRLIQINPKKVILNSKEEFFFSTLYLIETILEGKQFYDLNPHLQRVLEDLKQAPVKKQRFTFLNLALEQTLGKMMKPDNNKYKKQSSVYGK